jgi:Protein of unknown function (DUF2796)
MNRSPLALLMSCLVLAASPAAIASKAHEHGVMKLDVAIEASKVTLTIEAPLDNFLGFERAPRNAAERKAAADLLARLRDPNQVTALFAMDAAARCSLNKTEVQASGLEPGAKPAAQGEHADLDASYEFNCAQPGELRSLDVGLFEAYKRVQRIEVQVAGPKGQSKATLKRPARSVRLVR